MIECPVRGISQFKKSSAATLRRHRAKSGTKKMLEADECRKLIDGAPTPVKAMILLGLSCGFGNADVETLPFDAVNLESGWIEFPRPQNVF